MKLRRLIGLIVMGGLMACRPQPISDHIPRTPDLPAPRPRPDRAFRLAAHTLFLDKPIAQLAVDAGFDTIVQVFPWRDLQPRPNSFAWQAADDMVRVAQTHGLELVVRLDMPPSWAARTDRTQPPFDTRAYLDFVDAVVARYRGYITGYIIHNEPNLAEEWGGWVADPQQYADLLCAAFQRVHRLDPEAQVIAAGLAPTNEYSYRAMDDRAFLQQMLAAGASRCFDVFAAHDYGYGLPPSDAHGAHAGLNLARLIDLHDILTQANATQPVWITELGYTLEPGLHPHVSPEEQAIYLQGAFQRVRAEWPWATMFTVWNLSYTGGSAEMQGFSLINPDQSPRAAYHIITQLRAELDK